MSKPGRSLPPLTPDTEGIPIYSPFAFHLVPGQQTLINIHLSFEVPKNYILFLSSVNNPSIYEPLVCPGILNQSTVDEVILLLGNIYKHAITIKKNQQIATVHLVPSSSIKSIHVIGDSSKFRIDEPTPLQQQELDDLLNEFSDIFSKSDKDFGLLVNNFHEIDTADHKPFKSRSYWKSHSEEKIVTSEISKLVSAGLLKPSKSPWASPLLLIKKKTGGHQIVMDYRKLNSITKKFYILYYI